MTRRALRSRSTARSGRGTTGATPASSFLPTYLIELRAEDATRVTVRADGSVLIPRSIRNALLLDPGERLVVAFEGGVVTMRPLETIVAFGVGAADEAVAPAVPAGVMAEFLRKRRRR